MVEIGGRPILWHIMKIYGAAGINDFVILLGYNGYMIKEYFANYFLHMSDVTIDLATSTIKMHAVRRRAVAVTLLDTGARDHDRRPAAAGQGAHRRRDFCFTYGDGVTDVDIRDVIDVPPSSQGSSRPSPPCSRPGASARSLIGRTTARSSRRSRQGSSGWVNGGFFVASAVDPRLHRRRRHRLRAGPAGAAVSRRRAVAPTSTTASGTAWTRCGTRSTSSDCGTTARHRGRSG